MDVLGVKASYLNLSGTPGGIVEKIRRQPGSVWFRIFESYGNAHSSTSHRRKTRCLAKKTGSTCTEAARLCAGEHENKMPGQLPNSTPSTDSSVSIHQLSVWELPTHIRYRRKEETTSAEYLCIVAADISQTGVLVEDRMDWSGRGWQGIDLHLKTCCGP